jgi:hypothetical protein
MIRKKSLKVGPCEFELILETAFVYSELEEPPKTPDFRDNKVE